MANAILVTQVGATNQSPTQYTAASPSLARYRAVSTIIDFGDFPGGVPNAGGITPLGFINVQYHSNNQWVTSTIYTTQNGAAIATLVG